MSSPARAMRRLTARLLTALELPDGDEDLLPAVGRAVEQVRGRPVRLHAVPFPPDIASGLWIQRPSHDVIAYEAHTDLEHQLVIIGHEVWHLFEGHCRSLTAHGPAASRAGDGGAADAVRDVVAAVCAADGAGAPPERPLDVSLHVALRADASTVHQEEEAEFFGVRFATAVGAARTEARSGVDLRNLAGRIRFSLAHRIRP